MNVIFTRSRSTNSAPVNSEGDIIFLMRMSFSISKYITTNITYVGQVNITSGRWQAPAAVLPPEGWQRGRGPEGPEDKGHGHSRARRAREWPKRACPRARRARGRAKLSARLGACQCYYMFFTTQLKIAKFMGRFQDLNVGQKS